jgi:hypothetical protein
MSPDSETPERSERMSEKTEPEMAYFLSMAHASSGPEWMIARLSGGTLSALASYSQVQIRVSRAGELLVMVPKSEHEPDRQPLPKRPPAPSEIEPAFTPEEWKDLPDSYGLCVEWDGNEAKIIALANDSLPDSDPRKITRKTLDSIWGEDGGWVPVEYTRKIAAALKSYLPPEEPS